MKPTSPFTTVQHTDYYQITMVYAYWKNGKQDEEACFDLFFRKNPFKGEYTVFCGLEECLRLLESFAFTEDFLAYLKQVNPHFEDEFIEYLRKLDCTKITLRAIAEGSIVFPNEPLIEVTGPLAVCQLLETPLLNTINYATLIATNAARMRKVVGDKCVLMEFGLRRAQGPDGALSASRYAVAGGFDSTSNTLAGMLFNIPITGTHAHSFVQSYKSVAEIHNPYIKVGPAGSGAYKEGETVNFVELVEQHRQKLISFQEFGAKVMGANQGEYAAFIAYALAFPKGFCALVDSYHTIMSGVINFIPVAAALCSLGYTPLGVRLDSGDLSYLSLKAREMIDLAADLYMRDGECYRRLKESHIVASNDLSETSMLALERHGHAITIFGVGTNLVTCLETPALGGVYKLVEINGAPRMKIAQDCAITKMPIPGRKELIRCYNEEHAVVDVICQPSEIEAGHVPVGENTEGKEILIFGVSDARQRALVKPARTERLLLARWDKGKRVEPEYSIFDIKARVKANLALMRADILRSVDPVPYKLSLTEPMRRMMTELMEAEMPIGRIE